MELFNSRYFRIPLSLIVFLAGGFILFWLDSYGAPGRDELYQAICVQRYQDAPLGLLSYWIGNLWCRMVGFSFLNLRLLTSLVVLLTISFGTFFLFKRSNNLWLSYGVFLLSCFLYRLGGFYIYNWDTGAYPFEVFSICILLSYLRHPSVLKSLLLGVGTALMTLGRMPNIIFLPLSIWIIWSSLKSKTYIKSEIYNIAVLICAWLATMALLTFIILGSPIEYINSLFSGNIVSGHSPFTDYHRLFGRFASLMLHLPTVWYIGTVSLLIIPILMRLKANGVRFLLFSCWLVLCILITYWTSKTYFSITYILGYDTPVGLGLLISIPLFSLFSPRRIAFRYLEIWSIAALLLTIVFGSDSFFIRMNVAFVLPVIFAVIWKLKNANYRSFLKVVVSSLLILSVGMYSVHTFCLLRLSNFDTRSETSPFQGLMVTSSENQAWIDIKKAINTLQSEKITYFLLGDHLFSEIIAGEDAGPYFHDFHNIILIPDNWEKFKKEKIKDVDAVVVHSPDFEDPLYKKAMDDLSSLGFVKEKHFGKAEILYRRKQ